MVFGLRHLDSGLWAWWCDDTNDWLRNPGGERLTWPKKWQAELYIERTYSL